MNVTSITFPASPFTDSSVNETNSFWPFIFIVALFPASLPSIFTTTLPFSPTNCNTSFNSSVISNMLALLGICVVIVYVNSSLRFGKS